jgi:hypothetical protein
MAGSNNAENTGAHSAPLSTLALLPRRGARCDGGEQDERARGCAAVCVRGVCKTLRADSFARARLWTGADSAQEPGKRRRASATELQCRLLRSLDANLAQRGNASSLPPPRATVAATYAPAHAAAAAAPAQTLGAHAPRCVPVRDFYRGGAGGGEGAGHGSASVDEWLHALSFRASQRAAAQLAPYADFPTQAEAFAWGDARAAEVRA